MRKMASMFTRAVAASTPPPVSAGYLSYGPFTSTAKACTSPPASSARTTAGRMPLVSSFTGRPRAPRSASSPSSPGTVVGSPPVTVTPSSHLARRDSSPSTSPRSWAGSRSGLQARSALWQVGQRRLQDRKSVV